MTEKEFLIRCRELMEGVRKGYDLCTEIQDGLNDDYRNDRIPYGEWKEKTKENEAKMAFFRDQFDFFSKRFERLKKLWQGPVL